MCLFIVILSYICQDICFRINEEETILFESIISFQQAGGRISLNPSYHFLIDFHPSLKYLYSLDPIMKEHDGFILGLGMSAHFRFGEDPDSPRSIIRSIRFSETPFPPVFAAMQSFYINKPLTSVTITNTEKYAIKEVAVSFFQTGFMDFPTASVTISELTGGESREVPLFASFNQRVFTTEGITPLQTV